MATNQRFQCPACAFRIYNRRVPKCEACGAELPSELLFTPQGIKELDAAHARSKREQEQRVRRGESTDTTWGGEGSWSGGEGGGGGD